MAKWWTAKEVRFLMENSRKPNSWIAEKLGRTIAQIECAKVRYHLGKKRRTSSDIDRIIRPLYNRGLTGRQIRLQTGVSIDAITNWLRRNGLKPNPINAMTRAGRARGGRQQRGKKRKRTKEGASEPCKVRTKRYDNIMSHDRSYSDEVSEWLKVVDRFRIEERRQPNPNDIKDVMRIAQLAGYVRIKQE